MTPVPCPGSRMCSTPSSAKSLDDSVGSCLYGCMLASRTEQGFRGKALNRDIALTTYGLYRYILYMCNYVIHVNTFDRHCIKI